MTTLKHYVYLHRRATDNSVFYVGKGYGKRAYKFGESQRNVHWINVKNKHGVVVEIYRDGLKEDEAFTLEAEMISFFGRKNLCNLTDGGEGGVNPSDETRQKMSFAAKGKKKPKGFVEKLRVRMTGFQHSAESRQKISDTLKGRAGRPHTEDTKKIIGVKVRAAMTPERVEKFRQVGLSNRGKKGTPMTEEHKLRFSEMRKGVPLTEATKAKLRAKALGRAYTPEQHAKVTASNRKQNALRRKIVKCSNGMVFESTAHAAKWLVDRGVSKAMRSNISSCCNGNLKSAYGFQWEHVQPTTEATK